MTSEVTDLIGIGLADAIGQVRDELARAIEGGKTSPVAFRAGPVELEFEVGFARAGGIDGGFRLSVLSMGAKRERSSTTTHRVRVTLTPADRQGRDKLIGDIGTADPGEADRDQPEGLRGGP
jgi:Trypsin-co-occurring domain 2